MGMIRKQFYITEQQDAKLKQLAAARGETEAEVVRGALDGIDGVVEVTYESKSEEDRRRGLRIGEAAVVEWHVGEDARSRAGLTLDQKLADAAWQKELSFLRSLGGRRKAEAGREAWKFDREELYDDRLNQILPRH